MACPRVLAFVLLLVAAVAASDLPLTGVNESIPFLPDPVPQPMMEPDPSVDSTALLESVPQTETEPEPKREPEPETHPDGRRIYGDVLPRPKVRAPKANRPVPAGVRKSVESVVRFYLKHLGYHVADTEERFIEVAKHHAKREIYAFNFNEPLPVWEWPDTDLTRFIIIPDFTWVINIIDAVIACYDDPNNLTPYCGQDGTKCCFGKFPAVWTFPRFDLGFYDAIYIAFKINVPLQCPYYRDGKELFLLPTSDPFYTFWGYPVGILRNWVWAAGQTIWHMMTFVTDAIVLPVFPDQTIFELPNGGTITEEMACLVLYSGAFTMLMTLAGIFGLHLVLFMPTCLFCSCWFLAWPRNLCFMVMNCLQLLKPPSPKQLIKKAAKRAVGIPPGLGAGLRQFAVRQGWIDHKHVH